MNPASILLVDEDAAFRHVMARELQRIVYELDQHMQRDMEMSEAIQNAISSAGSLLLHVAAQDRAREDAFATRLPPGAAQEDGMADGLRRMAVLLEDPSAESDLHAAPSESPDGVRETYSMLWQQCAEIRAGSY